MGTTFEAIEEGKVITYKGKELKGMPQTVARLEVVQVDEDMSVVSILDTTRPLQQDDKVLEKMTLTAGGGS